MTTYLDFSATTPVSKPVADLVYKLMVEDFGNAGSRTHEFGVSAKRYVEVARAQIATVVGADKTEVIFTSGATESNNMAILGMREHGEKTGKRHIITTKIEHKAVLEPVEQLEKNGFEVTYLDVGEDGLVDMDQLSASLREETVLVTLMHVNNETGCIQPITKVCEILAEHDAYLHVDAAQSFGKFYGELNSNRIDFISASGHKIYAPKGIGALIARKRGYLKPPLTPLIFGGGQESGLRPGTLPVPLVAGYGLACEIAQKESHRWAKLAEEQKGKLKAALAELGAVENGENTSPFVLNFSIPGINSEAAMVNLKGVAAISNGSACTANSYKPSHVLTAMGLDKWRILGAMRVSFSFDSTVPVKGIINALRKLL